MSALPAYMTEPNYYRLAYQLASQKANWLVSARKQRGGTSVGAEAPTPRDVFDAVDDVVTTARGVLAVYSVEGSRRRWRGLLGPRRFSPSERRLLRFLETTIIPSSLLIAAGTYLLVGDVESGEDIAASIRAQAADGSLSYRSLYNLACYEATASLNGDRVRFHGEAALAALRVSLRGADPRLRAELARWALVDPTLARLRERPFAALFQATMARYLVRRESGAADAAV